MRISGAKFENPPRAKNQYIVNNIYLWDNDEEVSYQSIPVNPQQVKSGGILSPPTTARILSRSLHTSPPLMDTNNNKDIEVKKKVKLFHFQNPLKWLQIHFKFNEVKQRWDPSLEKEEFLVGVKYAVEAITSKVVTGEWQEMRGLLSRKEFKRLRREVKISLPSSVAVNLDETQSFSLDYVMVVSIQKTVLLGTAPSFLIFH